ncbi:curli-like amyloid fiber formation chaperone CsgH [Methylobacterium aerolatum]|uniref:CsgH-like domain-containing protein n=1 Tax=Methylobacterium aerolatum TaxID=418708 RepID=A0ABU0HUT4_9HYPH|nr:curli-like amyloid fiber formation chaperone CsgH [Methylobacterium aerolatum]MDQ0446091.1 hypothetical protein [Methylobacterium aerolatum]GJD35127.1 hypothetical protein FMGBMHLM_2035 [Methylobacterium aerolatum]
MPCALFQARRPGSFLSSLLTAGVLILSSATPPASAASPGVSCRIRSTPGDGLLTVQAVAHSDTPLRGRYVFLLDKDSEAGSSRNVQSGQFALSGGQDDVVSAVSLEKSAEGHVKAELTLDWTQGRTSCRFP